MMGYENANLLLKKILTHGRLRRTEMSAFENIVVGKLRLKGKALDVKDRAIKKKDKHKEHRHQSTDANNGYAKDLALVGEENGTNIIHNEDQKQDVDERLTPAERRYLERWKRIELERLAKGAKKSHRDRVHEFNQYLANLSEHYDIPKVGPG